MHCLQNLCPHFPVCTASFSGRWQIEQCKSSSTAFTNSSSYPLGKATARASAISCKRKVSHSSGNREGKGYSVGWIRRRNGSGLQDTARIFFVCQSDSYQAWQVPSIHYCLLRTPKGLTVVSAQYRYSSQDKGLFYKKTWEEKFGPHWALRPPNAECPPNFKNFKVSQHYSRTSMCDHFS